MLLEGKELDLIYDLGKEEEFYALRDVSFSVDAGEMAGIIGPSGSGKSSLLYVLSGLKKPLGGTVYYKDLDINLLSQEEQAQLRRNEFGFIYQKHFLIDYLTILDNVLVASTGDYGTAKKRALELLHKFSIGHLAHKKPSALSVGQRQRAAVARALINSPKVIFADEPTASLDHKNAVELIKILKEECSESALVIVTHDLSILTSAHKVVKLWDGRIASP